jgi:hypothetical protein
MTTLIITYRPRPDRAEENQRLVEAVYAELADRTPPGFWYTTVRLDDGRFVHLAEIEGDNPSRPALRSPPFRPASLSGVNPGRDRTPGSDGSSAAIPTPDDPFHILTSAARLFRCGVQPTRRRCWSDPQTSSLRLQVACRGARQSSGEQRTPSP